MWAKQGGGYFQFIPRAIFEFLIFFFFHGRICTFHLPVKLSVTCHLTMTLAQKTSYQQIVQPDATCGKTSHPWDNCSVCRGLRAALLIKSEAPLSPASCRQTLLKGIYNSRAVRGAAIEFPVLTANILRCVSSPSVLAPLFQAIKC